MLDINDFMVGPQYLEITLILSIIHLLMLLIDQIAFLKHMQNVVWGMMGLGSVWALSGLPGFDAAMLMVSLSLWLCCLMSVYLVSWSIKNKRLPGL